MKKKQPIKLVFNIISLLVPIGFLVYFFVSEKGFMDLMENIPKLNKAWLLAGASLQVLSILVDAFALYKLTYNYDNSYTLKKALKATAVGQFFSIITPAAVGGQPMQIFCLTKQNVKPGMASSCLLQKFLVYQSTITLYSFIAMICNLDLFYGELKGLMLSLALFGFISHVVIVVFMYIFSFNRNLASSISNFAFKILTKIKIIKNPEIQIDKFNKQLDFFHESNSILYKNKLLLITVSLLTAIQLTLVFAIPYTIYRAFNFTDASIYDMITAQAFVTMVSAFMPLPGGSGAAEGSFYVFFKLFFMENTIKSAILIWRIITYFFTIIITAPFSNVSKISSSKRN